MPGGRGGPAGGGGKGDRPAPEGGRGGRGTTGRRPGGKGRERVVECSPMRSVPACPGTAPPTPGDFQGRREACGTGMGAALPPPPPGLGGPAARRAPGGQEPAVVRLLAGGVKDRGGRPSRLGVSCRAPSRLVCGLLGALGVRTRFPAALRITGLGLPGWPGCGMPCPLRLVAPWRGSGAGRRGRWPAAVSAGRWRRRRPGGGHRSNSMCWTSSMRTSSRVAARVPCCWK